MYFCDLENRESKEVAPGVRIHTFWGEHMLLSIVDLDAGAVVPTHGHPHEQCGTVITGQMTLTIAGDTRLLDPGDSYIIPGGVEHSARADAPCRVIDVFSPVRDEYQY
jgi:quercetin dioxygenase-like cupin family protein